MKQEAGRREQTGSGNSRRQTEETTGIHKTSHQTFRKAQRRQTDRQQQLINVDREADTQEDR